MFFKNSDQTYKIKLPESTSKDVIEWFEEMTYRNKLSDELIALVYQSLKANESSLSNSNVVQNSRIIDITQKLGESNTLSSDEDFLSSLHNWQDSCNAVFKDDKPKAEKKGMLFV